MASRTVIYIQILLLVCCFGLNIEAQKVISENIYFIKPDGKSYLKYQTTRSDYSNYWITIDTGLNVDNYYQYISPRAYEVIKQEGKKKNKLEFKEGDFALMHQGLFKKDLRVDSISGIFIFSNLSLTKDGQKRGIINSSTSFDKYINVWVLPDNYEFVSYKSEYYGEVVDSCTYRDENNLVQDTCNWVKRGNTLTFFGNNLNNIVFDIRYKLKSQDIINELRASLDSLKQQLIKDQKKLERLDLDLDIEFDSLFSVRQENNETILELGGAFVFHSGETILRSNAREGLLALIKNLNLDQIKKIVIEGHTDNTPINKKKNAYQSNLELSVARSLAIFKLFRQNKFDPNLFEIRGLGATNPIGDNNTEAGKQKNRRIEIRFQLKEKK